MTGAAIVAVIILAAGLVLAPFLRRRPDCRPPADRLFYGRFQAEQRRELLDQWERDYTYHEQDEREPVVILENGLLHMQAPDREEIQLHFGRN